jgi:rubrerythrin
MSRANDPDKAKIIGELTTMKSFELSARDLYREIAGDSRVVEPGIQAAFLRLAEDEHRHAELVQEILDLIETAL